MIRLLAIFLILSLHMPPARVVCVKRMDNNFRQLCVCRVVKDKSIGKAWYAPGIACEVLKGKKVR